MVSWRWHVKTAERRTGEFYASLSVKPRREKFDLSESITSAFPLHGAEHADGDDDSCGRVLHCRLRIGLSRSTTTC